MGEISSLVDEILSNAPQNFWFLKSGVEREFLILYSAPAKVPLVAGVNQCIAKEMNRSAQHKASNPETGCWLCGNSK
jgi:hypothetical protein